MLSRIADLRVQVKGRRQKILFVSDAVGQLLKCNQDLRTDLRDQTLDISMPLVLGYNLN